MLSTKKTMKKKVAVQEVVRRTSDEIDQLKKTVSSLRDKIEIAKADARDEIQRIKVEKLQEIETLQGAISSLRQKYEKRS